MMRRRFSKFIYGFFAACCATGAFATDLSTSITGSVSDGSSSIPYRLFEPQGLAAGQKAPLVLFLHGMGDSGTDNVAQTNWMGGLVNATKSGQYASYVLAPQIDTKSWFQSFSSTPTEAMKLTIDALKKVINTENIDTSRVYVTGLSMGGMGTWDILAREPQLFAAAVPMSGGADLKTASKIKDIPIWAFHGGADSVVPVSEMRATIQALKDAGGNPKYTEVAGADHAIWGPIYADASNTLYPWLFSQHQADELVATGGGETSSVSVAPEASGAVVVADVPEPGTISCLTLAGIAVLGRRRCRRATR
jgi:predicted peptidase